MPSSIPDYEYDVFISYRQKDNKYDGWVTEFIVNLRKELEATFKEDIHIYSDENPYDGLHEVHAVKESLSSKLKCLIFIPIISQTYCDPKCYAWTNEFLVFKKLAAADSLGLKVKLPTGNVTSRIVPVRIHDLDAQDRALLEKEMDGPLRSIDFIFSATGVNRPLRAHEDHPHGNQNKTYYRDQINKVANLVQAIILALKVPEAAVRATSKSAWTTPVKSPVGSRRRAIAMVVSLVLLLGLMYFQPWKYSLHSSKADARVSIAILPLKVIGDLDLSQPLAEGVTDVIRSNLGMFHDLKVKSRTSVEKYRTSQQSIPEIAKELDVSYVLEGSVQRVGEEFRIGVQLVDAQADHQLWSKQYAGNFSNLLESQRQISESIAKSLKATVTPAIASQINKSPTSSFEAYDLFLRAKQASRRYERSGDQTDLDQAIGLMAQALKKDRLFAQGYAWLAGLKMLKNAGTTENDSSFLLAHRALELDSTVAEASMVLSELYATRGDDPQALRYTYEALKTGLADSASAFRLIKRLGSIYARVGDLDVAIYLFDAVLAPNQDNLDILTELFYALAGGHRIDKLMQLLQRVNRSFPESDLRYVIQAHVALERKDYNELVNVMSLRYSASTAPANGYDAYDLMYACLLRKKGKTEECERMLVATEKDADDFVRSQLLLIRQKYDEGLLLLRDEEIGWYTLTLCALNPIYDPVVSDPRFRKFMDGNKEKITEKLERIHQLEQRGYLMQPRKFLIEKLSPAGTGGR